MGLLFKEEKLADDIPDTFTLAKICLQNLKTKLDKNKQLLNEYIKINCRCENERITESPYWQNDANETQFFTFHMEL